MVKVYYWTGRPNFGDLLTPLLLKKFARLDSQLVNPEESELVMAGSLLDKIPNDYSGVIFGSGLLHEKTIRTFPNAMVLAVRGPLTARNLVSKPTLGDIGLLADELVPLQNKKYDLGIVPHWTDKDLEHDNRFLKFDPKIIRVNDDPLKVIFEIAQCKKIVSSSLHGIILADSFHIPRRIEIAPRLLSHQHQEGGLFKWRDYSASLGLPLEIGVTQLVDRNIVLERSYELYDHFETIKKYFGGKR